jgi:hypothetical protein
VVIADSLPIPKQLNPALETGDYCFDDEHQLGSIAMGVA